MASKVGAYNMRVTKLNFDMDDEKQQKGAGPPKRVVTEEAKANTAATFAQSPKKSLRQYQRESGLSCDWIQQIMKKKAVFHVGGFVIHRNCHYRVPCTENPDVTIEKLQSRPSVTVWCGIRDDIILDPYVLCETMNLVSKSCTVLWGRVRVSSWCLKAKASRLGHGNSNRRVPAPPGWGLDMELTSSLCKELTIEKPTVSQNDDKFTKQISLQPEDLED
ncbi:hypothetical protein ANN_06648 [Periplaneta americana]|uniref:Uncharacterized protein n=1 Tax=Periplaneta americana TaxID=6978 RepID=A0ABQ8TE46_PERAM|nr:hypothetical protein ANN_06648 [Periplaneta americana]